MFRGSILNAMSRRSGGIASEVSPHAEIHQFQCAVIGDHDVAGMDVPMDHAVGVELGEGGAQLLEEIEEAVER